MILYFVLLQKIDVQNANTLIEHIEIMHKLNEKESLRVTTSLHTT